MDISIIIRFHNEATYLEATLAAIRQQQFHGTFEIIAVNDRSNDSSRKIAEQWADQVLDIDGYRPGTAINYAVQHSNAAHFVILSAHTIPSNCHWLARLHCHMGQEKVAGVYGAQLYNINAKFLDKRDLDIFSTTKPRVESSDSDFWNANSMFSRTAWEEQHFDEMVYELEDHYWTKQLLPKGYVIHFEPEALVYHYTHLDRNDRHFLPESSLTDYELIQEAIRTLDDKQAEWPQVMSAGLTLASLTHSPHIHQAVPFLGYQLLSHWDFDVRWRMAHALGKIQGSESASYLVRALTDPSYYPRDEATWSLARLGVDGASAVLKILPELPSESLPFAALALGLSNCDWAEERAVAIFEQLLESPNQIERRDAAYFVGEIATVRKATSLQNKLYSMLNGEEAELCRVLTWALGNFACHCDLKFPTSELIELSTHHSNCLVRFEAVVALGKRISFTDNDADALDAVLKACQDDHSRVRYGAVQSLRLKLDGGGDVPGFLTMNDEPDFGVNFEMELMSLLWQGRLLN